MTTSPQADAQPHPTTPQLLKATAIAAAIAGLLLVVAVLPAEYGIDPTGLGKKLGLIALSARAEPTAPAAAKTDTPQTIVTRRSAPFRSDTSTLTLKPNEGAEIKAVMQQGDGLVFTWSTDGGPVNFDMHGEPPNAGNSFTSYWKDRNKASASGTFLAPFQGTHGWYWENRGIEPVTVTLKTSGFYEKIKKM